MTYDFDGTEARRVRIEREMVQQVTHLHFYAVAPMASACALDMVHPDLRPFRLSDDLADVDCQRCQSYVKTWTEITSVEIRRGSGSKIIV